MLIRAEQSFTLEYPGAPDAALAFLRDPGRELAHLQFLRALQVDGTSIRARLAVHVPMLGLTELPLHSILCATPYGARLDAQPLDARAWVELRGEGRAEGAQLQYAFEFTAHLQLPDAEKWGGAAFEKMVRAAAGRTLSRLAHELPEGIARGMNEQYPA